MDQTSVNLVSAAKKTIEKKGKKQVLIVNPSGQKIAYTVTLLIRADGAKLPAIVVFKTSSKDGRLPKSEEKKLKRPANVIVKANRSEWWNTALDKEVMCELFPARGQQKTILIRDQFSAHKEEATKSFLRSRNVEQMFIPKG